MAFTNVCDMAHKDGSKRRRVESSLLAPSAEAVTGSTVPAKSDGVYAV